MGSFSKAIGLVDDWPKFAENDKEIHISGLNVWAKAYLLASETLLYSSNNELMSPYYTGPLTQNVGLATELTLKMLLRGGGKGAGNIRKYGHNTYKLYCDSRDFFDEVKFIDLHMSNTRHRKIPSEVLIRKISQGATDYDTRWRVYFDHLRLLDSVYDKPYRSRYITSGEAYFPDAEIVLIGTKILLKAMGERLG